MKLTGELKHLEELYVHHNRISELPSAIGELKKLRVFHFQENYIPQFPTFMLDMHSLRDVDISDTQIKSIPSAFAEVGLDVFYWRHLDININEPRNQETRACILQMQEKGTRVVPAISVQEVSAEE